MKRRTLLWGAGSVFALGAVAGWRVLASSEERAIAKVLHKRLDYLKLDPDGVSRFARDIAASGMISSSRLRALDAAGALYTLSDFGGANDFSLSVRHGEERVVTAFLISSDFFSNDADENRVVKYLGLFDPRTPCSNPFARFVESTG